MIIDHYSDELSQMTAWSDRWTSLVTTHKSHDSNLCTSQSFSFQMSVGSRWRWIIVKVGALERVETLLPNLRSRSFLSRTRVPGEGKVTKSNVCLFVCVFVFSFDQISHYVRVIHWMYYSKEIVTLLPDKKLKLYELWICGEVDELGSLRLTGAIYGYFNLRLCHGTDNSKMQFFYSWKRRLLVELVSFPLFHPIYLYPFIPFELEVALQDFCFSPEIIYGTWPS